MGCKGTQVAHCLDPTGLVTRGSCLSRIIRLGRGHMFVQCKTVLTCDLCIGKPCISLRVANTWWPCILQCSGPKMPTFIKAKMLNSLSRTPTNAPLLGHPIRPGSPTGAAACIHVNTALCLTPLLSREAGKLSWHAAEPVNLTVSNECLTNRCGWMLDALDCL